MVPGVGRTGVSVLALVTLVFAVLLFPAAGLGSVPSAPADEGGPSGPDLAPPAASDTTDSPTPTPTPDDETTSSEATDTPTPTPNTTTAPPDTETDTAAGPGVDFDGLLAPFLFVTLGALLALGVGMEGKARGWPVFRRLPVPAVSPLAVGQTVSRGTLAFAVRLSTGAPRLAAGFGTALSGFGRGLTTAFSGLGRGLGALVAGGSRGLGRGLFGLGSGIAGIFAGIGRRTRTGSSAPSPEPSTEEPAENGPPDPTSVEGAWQAMVDALPVRDAKTKTPRELARLAVDRGLPAEPVRRLTALFEEVVYGGYDRTERTEPALGAYERIRRFLEGEE